MTEQARQSQDTQRTGMPLKTKVKIAAGVVLAVLVLIIMFQNTDPVRTMLLFWPVELPLIVLLLLMLAVGFVLGLVSATVRNKRRTKER
jgi:uncharacterized integral membrane protein